MTARRALTIEDFAEHMLDNDPFARSCVTTTNGDDEDVPAIHDKEFRTLTRLVRQCVRRDPARDNGCGMLLWGVAGIGKSHLLARFHGWARGHGAAFVYLHNIHASPELMSAYVAKCVVGALVGSRTRAFHACELYRLLDAAIQAAVTATPTATPYEAYRQFVERTMIENGGRSRPHDRWVFECLYRFHEAAHTEAEPHGDAVVGRLAVRWLQGDLLSNEEAAKLGVPGTERPDDAVAAVDDELAERIIHVITMIARAGGAPVILCFDQVENLESEQFAALTRCAHALLDACSNLLVVVSGVQNSLLKWNKEGVVTHAAWDRLHGAPELQLNPITVDEAAAILRARLSRYLRPFVEQIPALAQRFAADPLFPLGSAWFEQRTAGKVEVRPRDIINWAREAWAQEQASVDALGGPRWLDTRSGRQSSSIPEPPRATVRSKTREELVDALVERKLAEHVNRRRLDPEALPPDADNLVGLVEALLRHCVGVDESYSVRAFERMKATRGRRPVYDLRVDEERPKDHARTKTGIKCLVTESAMSTWHALRRIEESGSRLHHVIVLSDGRVSWNLATAGLKLYRKLSRQGQERFHHIRLSFDDVAALDALQGTIGDARSGDLEVEGPTGKLETVTEAEVIASHHRANRFRAHPFLRELLTEEPPESRTAPDVRIDPVRLQDFIVSELAATARTTTKSLARAYVKGAGKSSGLRAAEIKRHVDDAALELHKAGRIVVVPLEDYYDCAYVPPS